MRACVVSRQYCWSPKVFEDITADSLSFLRVLTPRPELILIGAGAEISFRLRPDVTQLLQELRIGVEVMDSVREQKEKPGE